MPAGGHHRLASASLAGNQLSLCLRPFVEVEGNKQWQMPRCFTLDLATGTYAPRPATPREVLGKRASVEPATTASAATVTTGGSDATVCLGTRCSVVRVPELAAMADPPRRGR